MTHNTLTKAALGLLVLSTATALNAMEKSTAKEETQAAEHTGATWAPEEILGQLQILSTLTDEQKTEVLKQAEGLNAQGVEALLISVNKIAEDASKLQVALQVLLEKKTKESQGYCVIC